MKKLLYFLLLPAIGFSQANTEIYLFNVKSENGKHILSNRKNISNNKGYDSQPSFYDDNTIIFASNRNGQTDIASYNITSDKISYINSTPNGGEYSPERIPNSNHISAVRLDTSGLQRFYQYNIKTGKDKKLINDLKVAYPRWIDKNTLIAVSIVNENLDLFVCNLLSGKNTSVVKNVGRSVHKIPNSNLVSFISKEQNDWEVKSLNLKTLEVKSIIKTGNKEDICWLPNGTLLLANGNTILKFNPKTDKNWSLFHQFNDENINNISRIMTNKDGTKLAIVAETSPQELAQEQLEAYNKRDIEAFLKPYAENVKVYTFPDKLNYKGIEKMRERYAPMFKNTKDLHCKIINRVVKGNVVIDEELVTANGKQFKAVAIYEVKNGKIVTVRFIK